MKPKISVILPVYNMEEYLGACLDSILNQDLEDLEIICINDGSTDSTGEILEEYRTKYGNIVLIDQENHGAAFARNVGIRTASGEFIAFMDPDDYLPKPDTYSRLYQLATEHQVRICGGSMNYESDGILRLPVEAGNLKQVFSEEGLFSYRDYQYDYGYTRFIYDRQLLLDNDIFFPEYRYFEDPPFFVKAMIRADHFYAVPDCVYCYRYGYKTRGLTEEKICALIRGLTDDLQMAVDEGLRELHRLTVYRFIKNYRTWIISGFEEQKSIEMMQLLSNAQSLVQTEWLAETELKSVYDALFAHSDNLLRKNSELKEKLTESRTRNKQLSTTLSETRNKLQLTQSKLEKTENKLEKTENKLEKTENALKNTRETLSETKKNLQQEKRSNELILNSTSYKIGSAITFLPGTAKRLIKRLIHR